MALSATQIWEQLIAKDARLKDDEATIEFKAKNLRALLRQVHGQGEAIGREAAEVNSACRDQSTPFSDFSDLFGGRS